MAEFDDQELTTRLAELKHREEESFISSIAPKYGYQYVDLFAVTIDVEALGMLEEAVARDAEIALFAKRGNRLSLAIRNPKNPHLETITQTLVTKGYTLDVYMASLSSLSHAWDRYGDVRKAIAAEHGRLDIHDAAIQKFATGIHSHFDVSSLLTNLHRERGPEYISQVVEIILGSAIALFASDIHIEPELNQVRLRFRLDGVLVDIAHLDTRFYTHAISRFKLLSGLKLNVKDEAQDGRFTIHVLEREIEIRTSVIPGAVGESIVMRILDPEVSHFEFDTLGLNARLRDLMIDELSRPNGAIITTGPTGSGKTTTLYAFLNVIHTPDIKIITLEDPVEYKLPGIVQTQVDETYTFSTGLRALLRQDPDVILVGEIRDRDVAETAVHAALTGHLVLSTLHTNSAAGAFSRLIDLGVDPRMIGSAFNIILAQRLVRKLCDHCKKERETTSEEQVLITRIMRQPVAMHTLFEPAGCEHCGFTGFKGRIGVYEGIKITEDVERIVIDDPRESAIIEAARSQNIPSMQQDAIMKVLAGITPLDEVSRVLDLYNLDA
jgi:type IV pilus assembly protein PilB